VTIPSRSRLTLHLPASKFTASKAWVLDAGGEGGVRRGPSYASPHPPLRDEPSTGLPSSRIHNKAPSSLAVLHKVLSHRLQVLRLRTQPSAYILFSCLDVSCTGPDLLVFLILDFFF
jgi:hypothetical protein